LRVGVPTPRRSQGETTGFRVGAGVGCGVGCETTGLSVFSGGAVSPGCSVSAGVAVSEAITATTGTTGSDGVGVGVGSGLPDALGLISGEPVGETVPVEPGFEVGPAVWPGRPATGLFVGPGRTIAVIGEEAVASAGVRSEGNAPVSSNPRTTVTSKRLTVPSASTRRRRCALVTENRDPQSPGTPARGR
jgi:hypothetical protein